MRSLSQAILLLFFLQGSSSASSGNVPDVIVIDKQGKSRSYTKLPPPVFTHKAHEKRHDCEVCHPKPFVAEIGANSITMRDNMNGEYCGKCHDGMRASGMAKCDSCHKAP